MTAVPIPIHQPKTPRVEIVDVTPAIATEWLGHNTRNRNLKPAKIAAYSRDMEAGNWRMTGEAIKFATDGRLLDGQNRLHAVIQSNTTVRMMVIFDLDPQAQDVMDGGTRRTNADQLGLHGVKNAAAVAAIASVWVAWQSGHWSHSGSQSSTPPLTHAEVIDLHRKFPELEDAATVADRVRKSLPLPTGVVGAAWMQLSTIDGEAAADFFDRIANLRTGGTGDPVSALIKRVLADRASGKRLWIAESFYLLFRTWNAYRKGERLTHFKSGKNKYKSGGTVAGYPEIPEPK